MVIHNDVALLCVYIMFQCSYMRSRTIPLCLDNVGVNVTRMLLLSSSRTWNELGSPVLIKSFMALEMRFLALSEIVAPSFCSLVLISMHSSRRCSVDFIWWFYRYSMARQLHLRLNTHKNRFIRYKAKAMKVVSTSTQDVGFPSPCVVE